MSSSASFNRRQVERTLRQELFNRHNLICVASQFVVGSDPTKASADMFCRDSPGIAAILGARAAMIKHNISGTLCLLGTPAVGLLRMELEDSKHTDALIVIRKREGEAS